MFWCIVLIVFCYSVIRDVIKSRYLGYTWVHLGTQERQKRPSKRGKRDLVEEARVHMGTLGYSWVHMAYYDIYSK